jgi:hypothetical protein
MPTKPVTTKHASSPTSVRLSQMTRDLLAEASAVTRRPQSAVIDETLLTYLPRVIEGAQRTADVDPLVRLMRFKGAGAALYGQRDDEDIDRMAREMRRDR